MSAKTSPQRGLPPAVVVAGSAECPFRLAIVGGGPSGCSVLVRAARIGLVSELCRFSFRPTHTHAHAHTHSQSASPARSSSNDNGNSGNAENGTDCFMRDMERASAEETSSQTHTHSQRPTAAGVCLFDAGPSTRLGGGRLQDYVINSNTWIAKFAANVLEEKPDGLPPEHVRGTVFDRLAQMPSTQTILKIGNKTGPLQSVGGFLRDVGASVLSLLAQYPQSCRVFTETKVQKLQKVLDENGAFLMWKITYSTTTTTITGSPSPLSPSDHTAGVRHTHMHTQAENAEVFAFHVLLATGGHQAAPRFAQASLSAKTLCSDEVCTEEGVHRLREMLRKASLTNASSGRVAIIGGSHSAFSAAWVLLNRVDESNAGNNSNNNNNNNNNGASKPANTSNTSANANAPNALSSSSSAKIKLGPSGVCILFRSPVKVFYATKAEADHDHYGQDGAPLVVNKITGQINPFGGIRGDAKELWRNIRANKEPRVRMLQIKTNIAVAPSSSSLRAAAAVPSSSSPAVPSSNAANFGGVKQSIVEKILEEATVIIWACGYSTNAIPILEANGDPISISFSRGQVDVDDQARVLQSSSRCVENLYGSGLGYGLKATLENGELDGSSGRADGVAVYLKRGATLVLAHVLGSRVFGGVNISSWEERNRLIRKQNAMNGGSSNNNNNNNEDSGKLSILVDSPVRTTVAAVRAASTTPGSRRSRAGSIASPVVPANSSFRSPNSRRSTPARPLDREKHCVPLSPTVQQKREQVALRPASTGRCSSSATSPRANTNSTLSTAVSSSALLSARNESRSASVSASASAVRARCVNSNSAPATPPPRIALSATVAGSATLSVAGVSSSKQTSMVVASKTLPLRNPVGIAANTNAVAVNKPRSATPTNLKAIATRGSKPPSNAVAIKPKPFPFL